MEPQALTPVASRRVRRKSIGGQIQIALDDAAKAMSADISVQKLVQTRLDCLLKLQARERHDKFRKLTDELKSAKAEIEKLKGELAAALSAKTAAVREKSAVERALDLVAQEESHGN